jgi:ABC-type multidrug transport system ATPase subunit
MHLTLCVQSKVLLQSVNGEAKAGRLLAIMGPSGSGKTTFLNVLAGQLPASARLRINGSIMINGHPFSSMKHRSVALVFCQQIHSNYDL